jgi:hypothetical protein
MPRSGKANRLTPEQLDELPELSTCVTTASAIEPFGVRLYNAGFANSTVRYQKQEEEEKLKL